MGESLCNKTSFISFNRSIRQLFESIHPPPIRVHFFLLTCKRRLVLFIFQLEGLSDSTHQLLGTDLGSNLIPYGDYRSCSVEAFSPGRVKSFFFSNYQRPSNHKKNLPAPFEYEVFSSVVELVRATPRGIGFDCPYSSLVLNPASC